MNILAGLIISLTAGILMLRSFQEKIIFFPEKLPQNYRFLFDLPFEEYFIEVEPSVKINALHFKSKHPKGVILYFHGNAGSLNSWGEVSQDFLKYNYDLFISDYRGFGKSSGRITSEKQMYHDAEQLYQKVKEKFLDEEIILYGRSVGTGLATYLATQHPVKMVILESPYFNLPDLAKYHYPMIPPFFLNYKFANDKNLQQIHSKTVLIHGTKDSIIPYDSSVRLQSLKEIKLYTIEGGGHNDLSNFNSFHKALSSLLK